MAHVAQIDENNVVLQVIVVSNDYEPNVEEFATQLLGGVWKQTSYNNNFRGTFASIGFTYNAEEDIFVAPQPFPSWIRNGCFWSAPVEKPLDGKFYKWNESEGLWNELS